jgi:DNA repair protein REV1
MHQQGQSKDTANTMHHEGSISNYMHLKNIKLREQFEANSLAVQHSNLFKGALY